MYRAASLALIHIKECSSLNDLRHFHSKDSLSPTQLSVTYPPQLRDERTAGRKSLFSRGQGSPRDGRVSWDWENGLSQPSSSP